jgi:hypothetical protein
VGSAPLAAGFFPPVVKPQRAGNRIYTAFGEVYDISSGALVGTFGDRDNVTPTAFLVDEPHGRIFIMKRGFLWSYDLVTLKFLAILQIDVGSNYLLDETLIPWGNGGVAVADGDKLVVLSGPFFSTYRGEPTM